MMKKLIAEKTFSDKIKNMSINSSKTNIKSPIINLFKKKEKKINLKKIHFNRNNSNFNLISNSKNIKNKQSLYKSYNSILYSPQNKKEIKINKDFQNFFNYESSPHLSNEDRKKLISIIDNFDNHKVITDGLFNQEKKLPLNSVNKDNFFFLNNENNEEKYNKIKYNYKFKRNKKLYISPNKSRNISFNGNKTDYSSSSMISRFNKKTLGILDLSYPDSTFSKKLNSFRKQIINSFTDKTESGNFGFSKEKYNNALKILDFVEELCIKRALEIEKRFYKAKYRYKNTKKEEKKNIDNDGKKEEETHITPENKKLNDNSQNKDLFSSYENKTFKRLKEKTLTIKQADILNKLTSNYVTTLIKQRNKRNSLFFSKNDNKKLILFERNDKQRKTTNKMARSKINVKRLNYTNDYNYQYIIQKNKKLRLALNEKKLSNRTDINKLMPNFYKTHNNFRIKKIQERAKEYANSFAEINYLPYQPINAFNTNNSSNIINSNNLSRVIKINTIKKYLYNIEDDDLLIRNSKKLKEEIWNTQMVYYKNNYRKKYNFSFLKKRLKQITLRKFSSIKDSYFGVPC